MRRLSLDHITVTDTAPAQLAHVAAGAGYAGICVFLHAMSVLPAMPPYDLIHDAAARARMRRVLRDTGVSVDLVYPFTLTGRSVIADFAPALAAAAEIGARHANVLSYDRDAGRRVDRLAALAGLAATHGVALSVEPYPPSQVPSLTAAFDLLAATGVADLGITLDLLHLVRAGEWPAARSRLADPAIRVVQLSDGLAACPPQGGEWEAGIQRLLPGEGSFALAAMLDAIAPDVCVSIEAPQQAAIDAGVPAAERARAALAAARRIPASPSPR